MKLNDSMQKASSKNLKDLGKFWGHITKKILSKGNVRLNNQPHFPLAIPHTRRYNNFHENK